MKAKRRIILGLILCICVVFCIFCGATKANVAKILIETPLFAEMDLSGEKVLDTVKQNETVEVVGEPLLDTNGTSWQKIRYNNHYEGYILSSYLYYTSKTDDYSVQVAKATGKSMTEEIKIYRHYDEESDVAGTVVDGEKINVVIGDKTDYGDFTKIVYKNEYCFIKTENVTTSLTYNQRIALYISLALIVLLIAVGTVIAVVITKRKREFLKKEKEREEE